MMTCDVPVLCLFDALNTRKLKKDVPGMQDSGNKSLSG
jgi:hypothetical protein